MADTDKAMDKTVIIFNSLLVMGFLGIVWLMIYGNLSGNLGFQQDSASFTGEKINLNSTGAIPESAVGKINPGISSITMINSSNATKTLNSANFTVTNNVFFSVATSLYDGEDVNVSYTVAFDSEADKSAEGVINNLTQGVNTFFTFSNVLFTITAIALLITILIGLLFLVLTITKAFRSKGSQFSA